ncbi:MAG: hypothetical protein IJD92_01535 [Bacilli bacterium]|nr:hypothetical protein [Bacilli bacterium]
MEIENNNNINNDTDTNDELNFSTMIYQHDIIKKPERQSSYEEAVKIVPDELTKDQIISAKHIVVQSIQHLDLDISEETKHRFLTMPVLAAINLAISVGCWVYFKNFLSSAVANDISHGLVFYGMSGMERVLMAVSVSLAGMGMSLFLPATISSIINIKSTKLKDYKSAKKQLEEINKQLNVAAQEKFGMDLESAYELFVRNLKNKSETLEDNGNETPKLN